MFSLDTKSIGIALALAVLLGALGACGWYLKKLLLERETCKMAVETQNKAILKQVLATEKHIENLEKNKEAVVKKYSQPLNHHLSALHRPAHMCAKQEQELEQIKRDLNIFKGGR